MQDSTKFFWGSTCGFYHLVQRACSEVQCNPGKHQSSKDPILKRRHTGGWIIWYPRCNGLMLSNASLFFLLPHSISLILLIHQLPELFFPLNLDPKVNVLNDTSCNTPKPSCSWPHTLLILQSLNARSFVFNITLLLKYVAGINKKCIQYTKKSIADSMFHVNKRATFFLKFPTLTLYFPLSENGFTFYFPRRTIQTIWCTIFCCV